jgi:hypothetical protein
MQIRERIEQFIKVSEQLSQRAKDAPTLSQTDMCLVRAERYNDKIMTLEWVLDDELNK